MLLTLNVMAATDYSDFRTKKSGLYNDTTVWQKLSCGYWVDAHDIPDANNSIFVQAGTTLTLDANQSCKDLNLNTTADVARLDTGTDTLFIYGKLRAYSGTAPGTNDEINSGVMNWISGNLVFKGTSKTIITAHEFSANATNIGYNVVIDKGTDTAIVNYPWRVGNMTVKTGTLVINPTFSLRPAGDGNLIDGFILVKSGATLVSGLLFKSQTSPMASFTVESGANFYINNTSAPILAAASITINGNTFISGTTNQFPSGGGRTGSAVVNTFNNLTVKGTGAKKLLNNVSVTGTYTLQSPATINKNGFDITNP